MPFGIGDSLNVRVTSSTSDFEEGMEDSRGELNKFSGASQTTTGAVQILQNRVNELGDEFGRTQRKASSLSRSVVGLTGSLSVLSVSVMGFNSTQLAGMIAGFGTLATTIVPLTASMVGLASAVGGVAAGFGAVIGTGIFAYGEQLKQQNQERLSQVNEQIDKLQQQKEAATQLTNAQQRQYEFLVAIEDANGELSSEQQRKLRRLKELQDQQYQLTEAQEFELEKLQAIKEQTGGLTEAQQGQLEQLEQLKNQNNGLTQSQDQQLTKLQEQKEELEETTTVTGALSQELEPVKEQLKESALALGQDFIPLIRDAIDALPAFIRRIEDSVGNLRPFADALRDAGQVASEEIPEMVAFFMDLGRESLPAVRRFGRWIADNWRSIIEESVSTMRELSDEFMALVDAIIDLIPWMNEVGTVVLETVVPAITDFVNGFNDLVEDIEANSRLIKTALVGSFIAIAGPVGAALALIIEFKDEIIEGFGELNDKYIQPFIKGFESAFENKLSEVLEETGETLDLFLDSIRDLLGLGGDVEDWGETTAEALNGVQDVIIDLNEVAQGEQSIESLFDFGGVGGGGAMGGLERSLSNLTSLFKDTWADIQPGLTDLRQGFKRAMPEIEQLVESLENSLEGFFNFLNTTLIPFYRSQIEGFWVPLFNDLSEVIGRQLEPFIDELGQTIQSVNGYMRTLGNIAKDVWNEIDGIVVPIAKTIGDTIRENLVLYVDSLIESMKAVMNLVQGDFDEALDNLENILGNIGEGAFNLVKSFKDGIKAIGKWLAEDGADTVENKLDDLPGILADSLGAAGGFLKNAIVQIATWLSNEGPSFIKTQLASLVGILGSLLGDAGGFLKDAFDQLVSWVKSSPQILADLASDIGSEIANGVKDAIIDALQGLNPANHIDFSGVPGVNGGGGGPIIPGTAFITGGQTGGLISQGGLMRVHEGERLVPSAQVSDRGQVEVNGMGDASIEVRVEGDTSVIEDVSARIVQQQHRRTKRKEGTTTNL